MSSPYPLNSFLSGISLAFSVHGLLILNGSVFGVSGWLHRLSTGDSEAFVATCALVASGALVGFIDSSPPSPMPSVNLATVVLSGVLVGFGTKLANGCTSGHMVCGLSRLSLRSLVATLTFMSTAAVTSNILHPSFSPVAPMQWEVTGFAWKIFTLAGFVFCISNVACVDAKSEGMTNYGKMIRFLRLPLPGQIDQWDPSLAFLALGAMPILIGLYHFQVGVLVEGSGLKAKQAPILGGDWRIPNNKTINMSLVLGSALFGVGWAILGGCPAPQLANLGHALASGSSRMASRITLWGAAAILGGRIATAF
ncbi:hypothetical protein DL96DRAFT_1810115 [Flagelloscypha sp. PMI_526]|nr:hypothetical protein DL96DRAFT_1810115 [Flagelloscypha sp. PMI_526]